MYIILLSNPNLQVSAMGTLTGRPFQSKKAAEDAARKYGRNHPSVDTTVLPIEHFVGA